MSDIKTQRGHVLVLMAAMVALLGSPVFAENVDPSNDGSQYAWGENVGWLNAEPNGDGAVGIMVESDQLSGWMWGENIGWVSLSCVNTSSCPTVDYGVLNDGAGGLTGFAWGENVGWINFAPTGGGVTIDPETGSFSGTAWGENIGWINFDVMDVGGVGITTAWRPMVVGGPPPPAGADLSITTTVSPDSVTEGSPLLYIFTVTNNGPAVAIGTVVTDTLPGGVTVVSALASQGSCSGTSPVTCVVGTLANGASATMTMVVTPAAAGELSNMADVAGTETDPTPANNRVTIVTTAEASPIDLVTLAVALAGTGSGQVTSVPGGIDCELDCSEGYPNGTEVTLTAVPASGATFVGWSGVDCLGTGSCAFVMAFSGEVTATFESIAVPPESNFPDLTGTVTKFKHKVKAAGDTVVIKVSVKNRGKVAPSAPVMVSLRLSDDTVWDAGDLLLTEQTIDTATLAPGEAIPVKLKIKNLPPVGGKFALLSIDDQDTVTESNEQNNMLVQQIGGRGCIKDTFLLEKEPNDAVSASQKGGGKIKPGFCVTISGRVETSFDVDRYRLAVKQDQTVEATLTHAADVNVDLGFFDVATGAFVKSCEAPASPEICAVTLSGIVGIRLFDVVVAPTSGTANYILNLVSKP